MKFVTRGVAAVASVAMLTLMLMLAGCGRKSPGEDPEVIAVVAGEPIRKADLLAEADYRRSRGRPVPGKDELLDELIERRRLISYARSKGIDQDPELVRSMDNLLIGTLKERELSAELKGIEIGEEELRKAYAERIEDLTTPAAVRCAIIKVAVPEHASEARRAECRARIGTAREMAASGADGFARAAARFSDDQESRYRAGDIGWIEEGRRHARVPEELLEPAWALPSDGAMSGIIETPEGFYLVRRTARREPGVPSFDSVAPRLRAELLDSKRTAKSENFNGKVANAIPVERFPLHLESVDLQADPNSAEPEPEPPPTP